MTSRLEQAHTTPEVRQAVRRTSHAATGSGMSATDVGVDVVESAPRVAGAVVVGTDGSVGARAALAHAVDHALAAGLPLVVATAYEPPVTWITREGVVPTAQEYRHRALAAARADVDAVLASLPAGAGRPLIEVQAHSGPAAVVLERLSHGASALVVGHRGRGAVGSRLIGSVGLSCVLHAGTTVVVVRR